MGYKVKLEQFEGPFDLLVYLIESARMSIYDIRVADITEQYLDYLAGLEEMNVEVSSDFMVLAAELIDLKAKMLLPHKPQGDSEEPPEDPRTELVARLLEYKKYRRAADMLSERETENRQIFAKPQEDISQYTSQPDEYLVMEIDQFVRAFHAFLARRRKVAEIRARYERIERQKATAARRRDFIRRLFINDPTKTMEFSDLVEDHSDPYDIALSFSALMEMIRARQVTAEQRRLFGPIDVHAGERLQTSEADGTEEDGSDEQAGADAAENSSDGAAAADDRRPEPEETAADKEETVYDQQ
ncbi:MAG: segregation and condensation protein A [Anaerovoracaceae bacterium]|jgi:segregation and condensation protein A